YTPPNLVNCLLDSTLNPVLNEACAQPDPEKAILALKVCDPACGSGHFLIAAAHRIAKQLAAVRTGIEEPGPAECRTALRDVVSHCIYGVDINPMAVEICKVSLWMEAVEPGKPLSYLDAHIQCGNSLLGATPALLRNGIPNEAFDLLEGDDKKICNEYKKLNKAQRAGQLSFFAPNLQLWELHSKRHHHLTRARKLFEEMPQNTVVQVHDKQEYHTHQIRSEGYQEELLLANIWCAAFVWKNTSTFAYSITEEIFRNSERNSSDLEPWMRDEIERLAQQYQFFTGILLSLMSSMFLLATSCLKTYKLAGLVVLMSC
ncbi:MAG: DNA methyltransferase, partial [Ktedonobacteraceae bacterium]